MTHPTTEAPRDVELDKLVRYDFDPTGVPEASRHGEYVKFTDLFALARRTTEGARVTERADDDGSKARFVCKVARESGASIPIETARAIIAALAQQAAPAPASEQAGAAVGEVVQGGRCELIPIRLNGPRPKVGTVLYATPTATTASASDREKFDAAIARADRPGAEILADAMRRAPAPSCEAAGAEEVREAAPILCELVRLRDLKADYDKVPHMHHVWWMREKLAEYETQWPLAWDRATEFARDAAIAAQAGKGKKE